MENCSSTYVSEKYPQNTNLFFCRIIASCGLARILQGVHPSDNEAGIKAVNVLFPLIKKGIENEHDSKEFPLTSSPRPKSQ